MCLVPWTNRSARRFADVRTSLSYSIRPVDASSTPSILPRRVADRVLQHVAQACFDQVGEDLGVRFAAEHLPCCSRYCRSGPAVSTMPLSTTAKELWQSVCRSGSRTSASPASPARMADPDRTRRLTALAKQLLRLDDLPDLFRVVSPSSVNTVTPAASCPLKSSHLEPLIRSGTVVQCPAYPTVAHVVSDQFL